MGGAKQWREPRQGGGADWGASEYGGGAGCWATGEGWEGGDAAFLIPCSSGAADTHNPPLPTLHADLVDPRVTSHALRV